MEKKKVKYIMSINAFVADSEAGYSGTYNYGSVKNVQLRVKEDAAAIEFTIGTKHFPKDIIDKFSNYGHLTDALRKIYILHALKYNKGLSVQKIILTVDGSQKVEITQDSGDSNDFPFVYSMIKTKTESGGDVDLGLGADKWRDTKILDFFLSKTKSAIDEDGRVASLYSLILSGNKEYEIEKFTNLWTAFNAYYNYYCSFNGYRLTQERDKISKLLTNFKYGKNIATKDYYNCFKDDYREIMSSVAKITDDEIKDLYDKLLQNATDDRVVLRDSDSKIYKAINKLIQQLKTAKTEGFGKENIVVKPFGLLLCDYAYNLRCKYLHGNKPTLLFSSGRSGEISLLRVINYFLSSFLKEHLPTLFLDSIAKAEKKMGEKK